MNSLTVPDGLVGVTASDPAYQRLRSTYTTRHTPGLILMPESDDQVAAAVSYAAGTDLPISVRSGGHGLSGRSSNDGGIVIDVSRMSGTRLLDAATGLVRVGAGARWGQVAAALAPHELAISSGDHANVGVGGLATAGGIGWLVREHGLTIDNVRAATLVLPNGSIVRTDAEHEPDLFWAVRGAGSFVGIVTDLDIQARHVPAVVVGQVAIQLDAQGDALRRWSQFAAHAPRELTMSGMVARSGDQTVLVMTVVIDGDDVFRAEKLLAPLQKAGRVHTGGLQLARYPQLVPLDHLHPNVGQQPAITTNALLPQLTAASARSILKVVGHRSQPFMQLRAIGGAMGDVAADATAFAHRDAHLLVTATVFPPHDGAELDEATSTLWPHAIGAYRNFDSRPNGETFARAFPGSTGERVIELARRYDPDGILSRVDR